MQWQDLSCMETCMKIVVKWYRLSLCATLYHLLSGVMCLDPFTSTIITHKLLLRPNLLLYYLFHSHPSTYPPTYPPTYSHPPLTHPHPLTHPPAHPSTLAYRQYFQTTRAESSSHWQKTMICTILLFPIMVVGISSALNCVAVGKYYFPIA